MKETSLNVELTVNREEITKLKNTQNVLQNKSSAQQYI